jgi:pleckstrin family protein A (phosphoinositide binding specific) protein 8
LLINFFADGRTILCVSVTNFIQTHIIYLSRALEFIYVFLETFVSGEQDLAVCARKAYGDTLKRYHGWIVQGIFSVSDNKS